MPEEPRPAPRLRPEEIVARSFATPLAAETDGAEGWSPKARRLFFVAMAVAGAILVTAGLLLTGELVPGPTSPRPLETGPDAGALGNLLGGAEQPPITPGATPPTPTTAADAAQVRKLSPVVAAAPQSTDHAEPQTTAATTPAPAPAPTAGNTQTTTPPKPAPPTTVPCTILGSRALGQIPPLCR